MCAFSSKNSSVTLPSALDKDVGVIPNILSCSCLCCRIVFVFFHVIIFGVVTVEGFMKDICKDLAQQQQHSLHRKIA